MKKRILTLALTTLLCGMQADADPTKTVVYFENFDDEGGAEAYNDGTTPETNPGSIPSLQKAGSASQGGTGSGQWFYTVNTVNGVDGLGFGATSHHYNWATGTHATAITDAGGFSIIFKQNRNGDSNVAWSCIRVGSGPENGDFKSADLAVLPNFDGRMQTYDGNSSSGWQGAAATGSYNTITYDIELKYEFGSWGAGSDVNFTGYIDGAEIMTDTFQWNEDDNVKIVFAGHRSNFWIDDIEISYTLVPESNSLGFILPLLCITFIFAFRRPSTVGIL
tara:strand:- start:2541 stop:3374 length:834 start_codon:yes stop_codon:yes gene_type:complete